MSDTPDAETSWQDWRNTNPRPINDRTAYEAGYAAGVRAGGVQALTDAAAYVEAKGDDFSDISPGIADWLRDRAATIQDTAPTE
jgi:hypothetical protein